MVATVIKIAGMNPKLSADDWTQVSADVLGSNIVVTSISDASVKRINDLKAIMMEAGKSTAFPKAAREEKQLLR